jgi:mycothiol synthase
MSSSRTRVELRAPTLDDLPALTAFFAAIQAAHGTGGALEGDIRDWLTNSDLDVEENFRIALARDRIVGWVDLWDQNQAHERLFVDVRAHPREREVFATLLDWAEERGRTIAAGRAAVLRASAASDNEQLAAELDTRGFRVIRHFFTMEIDLEGEPPAPAWPEGVTVRTLRDGEEPAVYEASNEAFADHWDFHEGPYDEWRRFFVESSVFDPTLWFVAEDDGEIAGFAICRSERRPGTGHVNVLGVRRPWRRRGLGTALLLHAFSEFRRRGREKADLGVDAENLTGAVGLYERAGMSVAARFDSYEKAL